MNERLSKRSRSSKNSNLSVKEVIDLTHEPSTLSPKPNSRKRGSAIPLFDATGKNEDSVQENVVSLSSSSSVSKESQPSMKKEDYVSRLSASSSSLQPSSRYSRHVRNSRKNKKLSFEDLLKIVLGKAQHNDKSSNSFYYKELKHELMFRPKQIVTEQVESILRDEPDANFVAYVTNFFLQIRLYLRWKNQLESSTNMKNDKTWDEIDELYEKGVSNKMRKIMGKKVSDGFKKKREESKSSKRTRKETFSSLRAFYFKNIDAFRNKMKFQYPSLWNIHKKFSEETRTYRKNMKDRRDTTVSHAEKQKYDNFIDFDDARESWNALVENNEKSK